MSTVAVVDYGMGNLRSVSQAVKAAAADSGHKVLVTNRPDEVRAAERVVLPGQGAMPDCMHELRASGLLAAVGLENLGGGLVGAAFVALLMSLCNPRFSATQYALLSGVYALSRSVLSGPAGFLAEGVGWDSFFMLSAAASLPAFLLMTRLTPWRGDGVQGAFDPLRDPT